VSKWRLFSFIFNRGKKEKLGGWDDSYVVLGKKFSGEKEV
jgi:hypothetical protein